MSAEVAVPARRALRLRAGRPRLGIAVGLTILAAMVAMSLLAPAIFGTSPDALVGRPLAAPSGAHPFGTDSLGRDVAVRTFVAARIDYLVAAVGVTFSLVVGSSLGVLVGMARRPIWSGLVMRVTDALIAVPFALLIVLIVVAVGTDRQVLGLPRGAAPVLVAIFLAGWAVYARLARAQTLSLRRRDFVTAARLMGYPRRRIVFRHVLPAVLTTNATYAVSDAILVVGFVASLPFLGAGIVPPTPEWGSMMYEGRATLESAWWVVVFPGAALMLTAFAVALLADGLIDRLGDRGAA